jgi:hypothetical protein
MGRGKNPFTQVREWVCVRCGMAVRTTELPLAARFMDYAKFDYSRSYLKTALRSRSQRQTVLAEFLA